MKLVVPMAGRGSRFANRGVTTPKPLIEVAGRPMVAWAYQSLDSVARSQTIFIALAEHEAHFGVIAILRSLEPHAEVILLDDVTEGQLCTVLAARNLINSEEDVLVASSDTYIVSNVGRAINERSPNCHGIISVADMPGEHWSFARTDETGRVVEVAEKVRISDHASTGLYYFSSGRELVAVADEMIRNGEKTRGEYFIIPVYQKYIQRDWNVEIAVAEAMWDMGTPEALSQFLEHLAS